eukprot:NODE_290_length_10614_cov_1.553590.p1 type:complete len:435 gc:universal NODE_290_length_10614_cov_1.553590:3494-4798(+)
MTFIFNFPVLALNGYFLHLTDIHIDQHYLPNATVSSNCHTFPEPGSNEIRAGVWGQENSSCDTPSHLVEYIFDSIRRQYINQEKHQPDFIVITGDQARHSSTIIPRMGAEVRLLNEIITNHLKLHVPYEIPIVPVVGNNDVHPHNVVLPNGKSLKRLSKIWREFIPRKQIPTFVRLGSYYKIVAKEKHHKLVVFSINTLFFFQKNDQISGCHNGSPGSMLLQWLDKNLAKFKDYKIMIAGHIPPEHKSNFDDCLQTFTEIMEKYKSSIVGGIYGHVNMDNFFFLSDKHPNVAPGFYGDEFEKYFDILRDSYEQAVKYTNLSFVSLVSPAIQPTSFPSFRLFEYAVSKPDDGTNKQLTIDSTNFGSLLNYKQFYINLTRVNQGVEGDFVELEYATNKELEMEDLSIGSWQKFAKRILESEAIANMFKKFMFVSSK